MGGSKGRGGVARVIGSLLRVGSSGRGTSVGNGANLTEWRCCVNDIMGQPMLSFLAAIYSISLYILRPSWLGKEVISLSPPPRRTGHASRLAPGSSNRSTVQGLGAYPDGSGLQGYVYPNGYRTFPLDERSSPRPCDPSPGHVSTLSGWALPYPTGDEFPVPFGCRPSLLGRPVPRGHRLSLAAGLLPGQTLSGFPRSA